MRPTILGFFVAAVLAIPTFAQAADETVIGREIYDSFQRLEFDRWDAIMAEDVEIYSPGFWGGKGLEHLKGWGKEFITALETRVDLVDEFEVIDATGNGRGFITVTLYWKHAKPFFGIAPTGREGTSVETFFYTMKNGKITRFQVADNTLDLAIYLWERGMPQAHNARPKPIIVGIDSSERKLPQ
ncbi:MAG: ester cyclase [Sphaerospermopsis sp. SIO1G2]|nr:ester cyclase [Sphaerospermopsis sp. SIO1G2]